MSSVRAEVRRFHSPDAHDLSTYVPVNDDFEILVQVMAGPAGAAGEESFDVLVCSASRIAARAAGGPTFCDHTIVCETFDWPAVRRLLLGRVQAIEGPTWEAVAARLSRIGHWEFDQY